MLATQPRDESQNIPELLKNSAYVQYHDSPALRSPLRVHELQTMHFYAGNSMVLCKL